MKFRFFAIILLSTAVLGFSQETTEQGDDYWYNGKPIANIIFTGLSNISQSELEALIQPYRGLVFNDVIFWEIQGKLYALEYFERIEPSIIRSDLTGTEVVIRFNVIERPVISRINFIGNSGLRNRELLEVVTSNVSDIFNQAKVRTDIDAIISIWKKVIRM